MGANMIPAKAYRLVGGLALFALLSACQAGNPFAPKPTTGQSDGAPVATTATRLVERDVEAPDVFQRSEPGLWAGTPSFGGVWVAHPAVAAPERAIIRNTDNGKFVIGSLFKREAQNPGPAFQISSDAAAALGVTAGQPTALNVTALRREEVPEETEVEAEADVETASAATEDVTAAPLPALEVAAAAIEKAEAATGSVEAKPTEAPPSNSRLPKPYIQIGIFSMEANADATADRLRGAGIIPTVLAQESSGKKFWRVIAGPARSLSTRADLLNKARELGFNDAYAVSN